MWTRRREKICEAGKSSFAANPEYVDAKSGKVDAKRENRGTKRKEVDSKLERSSPASPQIHHLA